MDVGVGFLYCEFARTLRSYITSFVLFTGAIIGAKPFVKLVMSSRDYREGNPGWSERKQQEVMNEEIEVRSGLEVIFRVVGQSKLQNFPVNSISVMTLSA